MKQGRLAVAAWAALAVSIVSPGALTAGGDDLYRAQAIVTGTGEDTRRPGLRQCLEDVLVKVSGDQRLIGDPRTAALMQKAESFVAEFSYRDRLAGMPIHDEQGSYDRPHDLFCAFRPAAIDAALRTLGRRPWPAPRPRVVVFLGVRQEGRSYLLTPEANPPMQVALGAAGALAGVPVLLPEATDQGLEAQSLAAPDFTALETAAARSGGDVPLAGTLTWSDEAMGWIADWRVRSGDRTIRWSIRGVSFDAAFRNGLRGAAQVLSGNGEPAAQTP